MCVWRGGCAREPPPTSGSHAKQQRRVQGRRPRVPAASCWVPWGSDRLVLWGGGAGATLLRAPHAQRSPPHGGNPKSGSRERGCAPWPRPPSAHHLSAPHGAKSSGLQPGLGAGVMGGLSPSSRCSSFSCCFSPWALEEPGWGVPGGGWCSQQPPRSPSLPGQHPPFHAAPKNDGARPPPLLSGEHRGTPWGLSHPLWPPPAAHPPPPSDRKQPPTSRCQTNLESLLSQSMGGVG